MTHSDFDTAMRLRHATAVMQVSARTQAQLRNRLTASTVPPRHFIRHRMAWAAATACAALLALVIGLQLGPQPMPAASPATVVAYDNQVDANTAYTALDENPDLYLWLASNDAVALASE